MLRQATLLHAVYGQQRQSMAGSRLSKAEDVKLPVAACILCRKGNTVDVSHARLSGMLPGAGFPVLVPGSVAFSLLLSSVVSLVLLVIVACANIHRALTSVRG